MKTMKNIEAVRALLVHVNNNSTEHELRLGRQARAQGLALPMLADKLAELGRGSLTRQVRTATWFAAPNGVRVELALRWEKHFGVSWAAVSRADFEKLLTETITKVAVPACFSEQEWTRFSTTLQRKQEVKTARRLVPTQSHHNIGGSYALF